MMFGRQARLADWRRFGVRIAGAAALGVFGLLAAYALGRSESPAQRDRNAAFTAQMDQAQARADAAQARKSAEQRRSFQ
jgi:hypothetical protein